MVKSIYTRSAHNFEET